MKGIKKTNWRAMYFGSKEVIRSFGTLDFDFISSRSGDWLDTVRKAQEN